jgi:hypothetical protein
LACLVKFAVSLSDSNSGEIKAMFFG